jgi:hypothetical protein
VIREIENIENTIMSVKANLQELYLLLENALASPSLTYNQICEVNHQGLYLIFDNEQMLYIGKTNRTGKVRMQELAADFRSHTFNKKLLSNRFREFGYVLYVLNKETKKDWINRGIISNEEFKAHQKEVNQYIRQKLKFKFYNVQDERKLINLEHFAIAILNPVHND